MEACNYVYMKLSDSFGDDEINNVFKARSD